MSMSVTGTDEENGNGISVIYLPSSERVSHHFSVRLPEQFDAIIHFDETRAVEPLDRTDRWESGEAPETYPTAL